MAPFSHSTVVTVPREDPIATKKPAAKKSTTKKKSTKKKPAAKTTRRRVNTTSVEARPIARDLATLALEWVVEEGDLKVRKREQLRRALVSAAEYLDWTMISKDAQLVAIKDVELLTKAGSKAISEDLIEAVAGKKTETKRLEKSLAQAHKLIEKGDFEEPFVFNYSHTARESDRLVTRNEEVEVTEEQNILDVIKLLEKKQGSWEKLRVLMLEDLKLQQKKLKEMDAVLDDYIAYCKILVAEVFQILY